MIDSKEPEGGQEIRLAILASHPIQYYAPLFRELALRIELEVLYAHKPTADQQAAAGFLTSFDWDVDLLSGYPHRFLSNVSRRPGTQEFDGCDTPDVDAIIRSGQFDAVLTMGWHLKSYIQGIYAAKRAGLPLLVRGDSHLNTPRPLSKRLAKALCYPFLLRLFDAALYVGVRNREYYEYYGYPRQRLFSAPHCIDIDWFSSRGTAPAGRALRVELGISPEEEVVLFAGKLVPFKRPLDVVEAVAQISKRRQIWLVVAGSGPLENDISMRASALGVRIRMLGFCNQSVMPSVYAASNVLVLPSTGRETWGLVCNEAIACNTPIVVSDAVGCAPDLAHDGGVGRTFKLGNIDGLASSITETLRNPPSHWLFETASRDYSLEAASSGVEQALANILSRSFLRKS